MAEPMAARIKAGRLAHNVLPSVCMLHLFFAGTVPPGTLLQIFIIAQASPIRLRRMAKVFYQKPSAFFFPVENETYEYNSYEYILYIIGDIAFSSRLIRLWRTSLHALPVIF